MKPRAYHDILYFLFGVTYGTLSFRKPRHVIACKVVLPFNFLLLLFFCNAEKVVSVLSPLQLSLSLSTALHERYILLLSAFLIRRSKCIYFTVQWCLFSFISCKVEIAVLVLSSWQLPSSFSLSSLRWSQLK